MLELLVIANIANTASVNRTAFSEGRLVWSVGFQDSTAETLRFEYHLYLFLSYTYNFLFYCT